MDIRNQTELCFDLFEVFNLDINFTYFTYTGLSNT